MCAIVDANVAHEVFGADRPEAGVKFFEWINLGKGRLVAGGKLLRELNPTSAREWARQALNAGLIRNVPETHVDARMAELRNEPAISSNDPHVLALAQISGARLLYTNDRALQQDFRNRRLIHNPPGKIYSTDDRNNPNKEFRPVHRKLLARRDLCRVESLR
jgi:predicted nucleic acid-binding protein